MNNFKTRLLGCASAYSHPSTSMAYKKMLFETKIQNDQGIEFSRSALSTDLNQLNPGYEDRYAVPGY